MSVAKAVFEKAPTGTKNWQQKPNMLEVLARLYNPNGLSDLVSANTGLWTLKLGKLDIAVPLSLPGP